MGKIEKKETCFELISVHGGVIYRFCGFFVLFRKREEGKKEN